MGTHIFGTKEGTIASATKLHFLLTVAESFQFVALTLLCDGEVNDLFIRHIKERPALQE
jgi:hypothetical protein